MSYEPILPLDALVARGVYRIHSRNLVVGVYDGAIGFIGIREKFGDRFLFREYHRDHGGMFGTVLPLELLGLLEESIPIREGLGTECSACHRGADYVKWEAGEPGNGYEGRWCHLNADETVDHGPSDHALQPMGLPNPALFAAIETYEASLPH